MLHTLPLFPLGMTLVPGLVLPLHIFEDRYRALVRDLLDIEDEDEREFGIVTLRPQRSVERDGTAALHEVGTTAVLRQSEELPDGRFDIVTTGGRRFRVREVDASEPLIRGRVEFLDEVEGPDALERAVQTRVRFERYRALLAAEGDDLELPDEPATLGYLVTAAMILPAEERQMLLAAGDTAERLRLACALLDRENFLIPALRSVPALDPPGPEPTAN